MLKLQFSGQIKKAQVRQAGTKTVAEVQLCKKVSGKDGAEDSFTWIKVTIWDPKDWQIAKLVAGAYISGCGDFQLRSYVKSDQTKGVSAEIRCSSFDIDQPDDRASTERAEPAQVPKQEVPVVRKPVSMEDGVPPF
jgi:hypothetical protein